jgi:hypothetical protein
MFQDDDAETETLAEHVKSIVHCVLDPNVDEGITALEVMRISIDKENVD